MWAFFLTGLRTQGADRLSSRLKFASEIARVTTRMNKIDHLSPKLR
jgi:hypothetical protein